jgi:hypothetical protein
MSSYSYRKIWEKAYGKIPKDENGRSYEIHHIDGNRENNNLENLKCVSIEEHYNIHYNNNDYGACVMIAKRMSLSPEHLSMIQKGVKRPGIGGVKKGTVPWNKGVKGYKLNLTDEGRQRMAEASKKTAKIKDCDIEKIVQDFKNKKIINNLNIGKVMRNGKILTYDRAFCKEYACLYNVTEQNIIRILKKYV